MAKGEPGFNASALALHDRLVGEAFGAGWNGGDCVSLPDGEIRAEWILPRFIRVLHPDDLAVELSLLDEKGEKAEGYDVKSYPDSTKVFYEGKFTPHYAVTLQAMPIVARPERGDALEELHSGAMLDPVSMRAYRAAAERSILLAMSQDAEPVGQ